MSKEDLLRESLDRREFLIKLSGGIMALAGAALLGGCAAGAESSNGSVTSSTSASVQANDGDARRAGHEGSRASARGTSPVASSRGGGSSSGRGGSSSSVGRSSDSSTSSSSRRGDDDDDGRRRRRRGRGGGDDD